MTPILPSECPNCRNVANLFKWWGSSNQKWCNPCISEASKSFEECRNEMPTDADHETACYENPGHRQRPQREECVP